MELQAIRHHALVLISTVAGIAGMGIVFGGAMQGNLHTMAQGAPLLLLGLWWSGRGLGRSMLAGRARRSCGSPYRAASRKDSHP